MSVGVDFARCRLVQRANGDLAVVGLGVEKAVGEIDLPIDALLPSHRQIEFGKEALVVVVDAIGPDQVDVEIERVDRCATYPLRSRTNCSGASCEAPSPLGRITTNGVRSAAREPGLKDQFSKLPRKAPRPAT